MPSLREVQQKLESARGLGNIVGSMRTLAAIYVRRAEAALEASRPYAEVVETALLEALERLASSGTEGKEPGETGLLVVFASDQGLAGAYNDRVVDAAENFKRSRGDLDLTFVAIGQRGTDLLALRGDPPIDTLGAPVSLEGVKAVVREAAARIYEIYIGKGLRSLFFAYNVYESVGRFSPIIRQILPPQPQALRQRPHRAFRTEPILTAPAGTLLEHFAEQFFFIELYGALLESQASENGARLAAMSQASSNIEDQIADLTQLYRSARQEQITSELLDVVSGAEALRTNE